ncbi:MAG TPA: hypothetical protein VFZ93_14620, partial [Albitalea sp.]
AKALARGAAPDAAPCAGEGIADNRLDGAGTVCTEAGLVGTRHGYPASLPPGAGPLPGILGAAGFGAARHPDAGTLRAQGYDVHVQGAVTTIARADAPDGTQCRFAYTEPPAPRTAAVVSPLLVAGC